MKREEALRIIKECKEKGFKHTFYTLNEYHTALDIAIKALEQEPCDNAVSRQDVLDLAKKGVLVSNGNYESVCKAINELPSVNPQPCEDAISRQAALNALYALCDTGETLIENPWRDNPHIDAVVETIEELPPVNPQPKTGHWITTPQGERCSNCLEEFRSLRNYSYCPNCGCRMVEPQERSDKE